MQAKGDSMYTGIYSLPRIERIVFGRPAAEVVAAEAARLDAKRVFVMAPAIVIEKTDIVAGIVQALGLRHAGTWDRMAPHTPREDVVAAAAEARAVRADLIVTVGGGSITDAAKLVQTCLSNDVIETSQLDALRLRPGEPMTIERADIRPPEVRMIAVPTTLAGAEFTPYAGVTNTARGVKEVFSHPLQVPRVIVLDPRVALPTPEALWLSTGIRALDHAVEDICSIDAQPYSEGAALQAIRLLGRALPATKKDPSDLPARLDAQVAMWLSTVGSQAGVNKGASHAIGHALGGTGGVPHGYTSCVMMPHVLRFNRPVAAARQALISQALGEPDTDAATLVTRLIAQLGLPTRLRDVGISTDTQLDAIAEAAMHDPWIRTNPRAIDSASVVRALLDEAR
jgi:maleylacetate reductase